jgi:hypothetical protein
MKGTETVRKPEESSKSILQKLEEAKDSLKQKNQLITQVTLSYLFDANLDVKSAIEILTKAQHQKQRNIKYSDGQVAWSESVRHQVDTITQDQRMENAQQVVLSQLSLSPKFFKVVEELSGMCRCMKLVQLIGTHDLKDLASTMLSTKFSDTSPFRSRDVVKSNTSGLYRMQFKCNRATVIAHLEYLRDQKPPADHLKDGIICQMFLQGKEDTLTLDYIGIITSEKRTLEIRTMEHFSDRRTPFDRFLHTWQRRR